MLTHPTGKMVVLPGVQPNIGLEAEFRRLLRDLLEETRKSVEYWVRAAYRANEPEMAQLAADAVPAAALRAALRRLIRRWNRNWAEAADDLAKYFAQSSYRRSDAQLKAILKKHGISVEFRMTRAMRDIFHATVNQNVNLIKSIPTQYLGQVEQSVMRSVQAGRDLRTLSRELQEHYGVSRRRAALISRDQNNKATSAFTRARQIELGITEAIWLHSHAGKVPRRTHIKMDGRKYDVIKGMWDEDENAWVFPGQLINCRCLSKSVVAGFS